MTEEPRWACCRCGCTDRTAVPSGTCGSREVCAGCGSNEFRSTVPDSPEFRAQLREVLNYGAAGGVPGAA